MSGHDRKSYHGPAKCKEISGQGLPCMNWEILGLECCWWHTPQDPDIEAEVEQITGWKFCRAMPGCRTPSVDGTSPPSCKGHGANAGSNQRLGAERRKIEESMADRLQKIMNESPGLLMDAVPVENPLDELLKIAGEIKALNLILKARVSQIRPEGYRYSRDKVGEQTRAEVLLLERAQERLARVLVDIAKLNIADRLAEIEERQVMVIERALNMALQAAGLDLRQQEAARQVIRRELGQAA